MPEIGRPQKVPETTNSGMLCFLLLIMSCMAGTTRSGKTLSAFMPRE